MSAPTRLWQCPGCAETYRIPEDRADPTICRACQHAEDEKSAPPSPRPAPPPPPSAEKNHNDVNAAETKHMKAFKSSKLKPREKVVNSLVGWIGEMMGSGDKKQHNGQFILTNSRVCFYQKGFFGEVFETIPLTKITSVESLSKLGYRVLRLHTSHDELAFKTFESAALFEQVQEQIESLRDGIQSTQVRDERECPYCAELILCKAKVCKHCGRDVG